MSSESLHIFAPRWNLQTQGFTGQAAATTMYDATETGVSIAGKHLPGTDLSGLKLEFDIEYNHALGC